MATKVLDQELTVAEVAVMLTCSTQTVDRYRAAGKLRAHTRGTGVRPRVFYLQSEVIAFLRSRDRSAS